MPTTIRTPSSVVTAARRLSWSQTVQFLTLLLRMRWLNWRLQVAHRQVDRYGFDSAGTELALRLQQWLACHEAISVLLGCPEPPHVAHVRSTLVAPRR